MSEELRTGSPYDDTRVNLFVVWGDAREARLEVYRGLRVFAG